MQILSEIRAVATAGESGEIICPVSNARFYRFSVGQLNFTKFEHNTSIGVAMKNFGTEF